MKIKLFTFSVLMLCSSIVFAQRKSLREILATADIIAITDEIPNPFYPIEKKHAVNNFEAYTVVDSVNIVSFIKKSKKDLSKNFWIHKALKNSFFDVFRFPQMPIKPVEINSAPRVKKTLLFSKSEKQYNEVLYFVELDENDVQSIKNFINWTDSVAKLKNEAIKCKLYIQKYIDMLPQNTNKDTYLSYFDNILMPTSNFMLYYKVKVPEATILTIDQKEKLKDFLLNNDDFLDIEFIELVYQYYPAEVLNFYQDKLKNLSTYNDEFKKDIDNYIIYLKFVFDKTNRINKDTELFFSIINNSSTDEYTKREIFELLQEKLNTSN